MPEEFMAYCVKEKAQKPMKDAREVVLKNGKHAMQGVCSSCGTKMMKFVSSKKVEKPAAPLQPNEVLAQQEPITPEPVTQEPVTQEPVVERTTQSTM